MLYRDNKSCESTKIRPIRLTNWPESHFCIQTWHKRDIVCTCNKLASSRQVFHPLFTKNRNATNQSWRISTWCIRHFLPVLLSSEVLRCNSQIVIPIFSCWYGNATTVSDVSCLFVVYMYTKHVTYQFRNFSFYNYSRTPFVGFICIKQTVTVALLNGVARIFFWGGHPVHFRHLSGSRPHSVGGG